jgi:hypothetical protein
MAMARSASPRVVERIVHHSDGGKQGREEKRPHGIEMEIQALEHDNIELLKDGEVGLIQVSSIARFAKYASVHWYDFSNRYIAPVEMKPYHWGGRQRMSTNKSRYAAIHSSTYRDQCPDNVDIEKYL